MKKHLILFSLVVLVCVASAKAQYVDVTTIDVQTETHKVKVVKKKKETKDFFRETGFSLDGSAYASPYLGLGVGVDLFLHNIDLGASVSIGQETSVCWYEWDDSYYSTSFNMHYVPRVVDVHLGYAFRLGQRFRMTPQLGVNMLSVKGTSSQYYRQHTLSATSPKITLMMECALSKHLSFYLSPGVLLSGDVGNRYNEVVESSVPIDGWYHGFAMKGGFRVNF